MHLEAIAGGIDNTLDNHLRLHVYNTGLSLKCMFSWPYFPCSRFSSISTCCCLENGQWCLHYAFCNTATNFGMYMRTGSHPVLQLKKSIEEKASAVKSADDGAADLKKRVEELSKSLEESEKDYQGVAAGKSSGNEDKCLEDQLENELHTRSKDVESVQKALESLPYEDGKMEALQKDRASELEVVQKFKDEIQILSAQLANVDFTYRDPVKNFDRSKVKGVVAKLIKVKDSSTLTALEVAAGGKMFNVVVDTENTGKQLLQNGELRRRVTIIPLNKIQSHPVPLRVQNTAVRLVGKGNAEVALSLVGYAEELKKDLAEVVSAWCCAVVIELGGGDLLRQLHALAEAESKLSVHQKTLSVIEAKGVGKGMKLEPGPQMGKGLNFDKFVLFAFSD
ncbi:hypothetical protein RHGRI_017419 [Rhododendron griersonianum]|uniref:SMC hinge domain-containing protein n=1 Tax=Rhododendron griersonianum TaxID=479676 RepID=A0AAV6JXT5_9ERIC|nr:hypothetical protein RHGRI_017419 [Rhododendron griersonianum]